MSLGSGPAAVVVEESYTAQTTARVVTAVYISTITFLEVSLRLSYADLHVSESLTVIGDSTHPHTPPKASTLAPHASSSTPIDVTRDVISAMSALATSASSHLLTSAPRHPLTVDRVDFGS